VVLVLLAGLLAYMYWPMEQDKITISPETTYIESPLNADGTPNYVAHLNDKYAEGVTPENNAAPLLLKAFGPDALPSECRYEWRPDLRGNVLDRLGLPADFFDHNTFFVKWENRARPDRDDANSAEELDTHEAKKIAEQPMRLDGEFHPDLEGWLARNAGPLKLVRQASTKDMLHFPLISTEDPPQLSEVLRFFNGGIDYPSVRDAGTALYMRGLMKADRRDVAGGWDDMLAVHRLARLMGRTPNLFDRFWANDLNEGAALGGIELATRFRLQPAEARKILASLAELKPMRDIADVLDESERFETLDYAVRMYRTKGDLTGRGRGNLSIDWNQMLLDVNAWYDRMVKLYRAPALAGRAKQICDYCAEAGDFPSSPTLTTHLFTWGGRPFKGALTRNVTQMMLALVTPNFSQPMDQDDRAKMTFDLEKLAVAMACFHAENGRWPRELKELSPGLLEDIPLDRFSGKPLIYRPREDGYLLYSIGINMWDDGGLTREWVGKKQVNRNKDEIAVEVKPPHPTSTTSPAPEDKQ
jgi:hypothetical protein